MPALPAATPRRAVSRTRRFCRSRARAPTWTWRVPRPEPCIREVSNRIHCFSARPSTRSAGCWSCRCRQCRCALGVHTRPIGSPKPFSAPRFPPSRPRTERWRVVPDHVLVGAQDPAAAPRLASSSRSPVERGRPSQIAGMALASFNSRSAFMAFADDGAAWKGSRADVGCHASVVNTMLTFCHGVHHEGRLSLSPACGSDGWRAGLLELGDELLITPLGVSPCSRP